MCHIDIFVENFYIICVCQKKCQAKEIQIILFNITATIGVFVDGDFNDFLCCLINNLILFL